jgi:hypothetical protein
MTTATDTEWRFPIEAIMAKHKARIDGNEDFVPFILETWHIGEPIPSWTVWIGSVPEGVEQKHCAMYAADIMCRATGCDYLLFSFDTHMSSEPLNPTTGKPWGPGEMQRMCDAEGYCETGNIRDNLVVCVIRRSDGKLRFESIPYHFHKPNGVDSEIMFWDNHLMTEWPEEIESADMQGQMMGMIPDKLRAAITAPLIRDLMKEKLGLDPEVFGLEPSAERLHTIMAGVRILATAAAQEKCETMFMSVLPANTEEEREILQHSVERDPSIHMEDLTVGADDAATA